MERFKKTIYTDRNYIYELKEIKRIYNKNNQGNKTSVNKLINLAIENLLKDKHKELPTKTIQKQIRAIKILSDEIGSLRRSISKANDNINQIAYDLNIDSWSLRNSFTKQQVKSFKDMTINDIHTIKDRINEDKLNQIGKEVHKLCMRL